MLAKIHLYGWNFKQSEITTSGKEPSHWEKDGTIA